MTNKKFILSTIKSNETEIFRYGIKSIGLFGSYARDEQTENSDIDILIDFEPEKENFDNYMAVYDIIERLLEKQRKRYLQISKQNGALFNGKTCQE